jgi:hypothetical protein
MQKTKENVGRQYIYIIREREFIIANKNVYKIGKTTKEPNSRLAGYPKGSEVLIFVAVNNCHNMEKKLIRMFISEFVQSKEYGYEYFTGNIETMIKSLMTLVISEGCEGLKNPEDETNTKIIKEIKNKRKSPLLQYYIHVFLSLGDAYSYVPTNKLFNDFKIFLKDNFDDETNASYSDIDEEWIRNDLNSREIPGVHDKKLSGNDEFIIDFGKVNQWLKKNKYI